MTIKYEPRETYKGIAIQNFQTRERIELRVKPEIDRVLALTNVEELKIYCSNISRPPEARMLAGAMLESIFKQAADDRLVRPDIDLAWVRAHTAGLEETCGWRSPWSYGVMTDDFGGPGKAEVRPEPLTDAQLRGDDT